MTDPVYPRFIAINTGYHGFSKMEFEYLREQYMQESYYVIGITEIKLEDESLDFAVRDIESYCTVFHRPSCNGMHGIMLLVDKALKPELWEFDEVEELEGSFEYVVITFKATVAATQWACFFGYRFQNYTKKVVQGFANVLQRFGETFGGEQNTDNLAVFGDFNIRRKICEKLQKRKCSEASGSDVQGTEPDENLHVEIGSSDDSKREPAVSTSYDDIILRPWVSFEYPRSDKGFVDQIITTTLAKYGIRETVFCSTKRHGGHAPDYFGMKFVDSNTAAKYFEVITKPLEIPTYDDTISDHLILLQFPIVVEEKYFTCPEPLCIGYKYLKSTENPSSNRTVNYESARAISLEDHKVHHCINDAPMCSICRHEHGHSRKNCLGKCWRLDVEKMAEICKKFNPSFGIFCKFIDEAETCNLGPFSRSGLLAHEAEKHQITHRWEGEAYQCKSEECKAVKEKRTFISNNGLKKHNDNHKNSPTEYRNNCVKCGLNFKRIDKHDPACRPSFLRPRYAFKQHFVLPEEGRRITDVKLAISPASVSAMVALLRAKNQRTPVKFEGMVDLSELYTVSCTVPRKAKKNAANIRHIQVHFDGNRQFFASVWHNQNKTIDVYMGMDTDLTASAKFQLWKMYENLREEDGTLNVAIRKDDEQSETDGAAYALAYAYLLMQGEDLEERSVRAKDIRSWILECFNSETIAELTVRKINRKFSIKNEAFKVNDMLLSIANRFRGLKSVLPLRSTDIKHYIGKDDPLPDEIVWEMVDWLRNKWSKTFDGLLDMGRKSDIASCCFSLQRNTVQLHVNHRKGHAYVSFWNCSEKKLYILDSKGSALHPEDKLELWCCYGYHSGGTSLSISYLEVQRQKEGEDCRSLALAFIELLAAGLNLEEVLLKKKDIRNWIDKSMFDQRIAKLIYGEDDSEKVAKGPLAIKNTNLATTIINALSNTLQYSVELHSGVPA